MERDNSWKLSSSHESLKLLPLVLNNERPQEFPSSWEVPFKHPFNLETQQLQLCVLLHAKWILGRRSSSLQTFDWLKSFHCWESVRSGENFHNSQKAFLRNSDFFSWKVRVCNTCNEDQRRIKRRNLKEKIVWRRQSDSNDLVIPWWDNNHNYLHNEWCWCFPRT